jgi:predicted MFS family arabinose efflux permease
MLWGMLAGYTVKITPPALSGRALSLVAGGAPVGIAFGTPLGAWLGVTFGWRWSFGGLGILTAVLLLLAVLLVPDAPGQQATARLPLARVFRIPGVAPILFVIFAWMLGNSTTYTYIAPVPQRRRVRGVDRDPYMTLPGFEIVRSQFAQRTPSAFPFSPLVS